MAVFRLVLEFVGTAEISVGTANPVLTVDEDELPPLLHATSRNPVSTTIKAGAVTRFMVATSSDIKKAHFPWEMSRTFPNTQSQLCLIQAAQPACPPGPPKKAKPSSFASPSFHLLA